MRLTIPKIIIFPEYLWVKKKKKSWICLKPLFLVDLRSGCLQLQVYLGFSWLRCLDVLCAVSFEAVHIMSHVMFLKSVNQQLNCQINIWVLWCSETTDIMMDTGQRKRRRKGLPLLKDDLCDLSKTAECSGKETLAFIKIFNTPSGTCKKSKERVFCIKVSPQNIPILSKVST